GSLRRVGLFPICGRRRDSSDALDKSSTNSTFGWRVSQPACSRKSLDVNGSPRLPSLTDTSLGREPIQPIIFWKSFRSAGDFQLVLRLLDQSPTETQYGQRSEERRVGKEERESWGTDE